MTEIKLQHNTKETKPDYRNKDRNIKNIIKIKRQKHKQTVAKYSKKKKTDLKQNRSWHDYRKFKKSKSWDENQHKDIEKGCSSRLGFFLISEENWTSECDVAPGNDLFTPIFC